MPSLKSSNIDNIDREVDIQMALIVLTGDVMVVLCLLDMLNETS